MLIGRAVTTFAYPTYRPGQVASHYQVQDGIVVRPPASLSARPLVPATWDDFARLVNANNGVWGGCWCIGFHVEGLPANRTVEGNRRAKHAHVMNGTVHQMLVYADDECVGWCQYGPPAELPNINNRKRYDAGVVVLPDWRIGCIFTGSRFRGQGVARVAVSAALDAIREAGGGLVEAYPEQVEGRAAQRGAYFHTGPETLFEEFGFTRDRQIAKWRWVMRLRIDI
jgi:GNAT superfamily N-acetyltransferase